MGRWEPGESPADAVAREGFEELGTQVTPLDPIATHYIPRYAIELTAWTDALDASQLNPSPVEIAEIVWLYPDEIAAHPEGLPSNPIFAPYLSTDPKVLRLLIRLRGGSAS